MWAHIITQKYQTRQIMFVASKKARLFNVTKQDKLIIFFFERKAGPKPNTLSGLLASPKYIRLSQKISSLSIISRQFVSPKHFMLCKYERGQTQVQTTLKVVSKLHTKIFDNADYVHSSTVKHYKAWNYFLQEMQGRSKGTLMVGSLLHLDILDKAENVHSLC